MSARMSRNEQKIYHCWEKIFCQNFGMDKESMEELKDLTYSIRAIQKGYGFKVTGILEDLDIDLAIHYKDGDPWLLFKCKYQRKYPDIFKNEESLIQAYKDYISNKPCFYFLAQLTVWIYSEVSRSLRRKIDEIPLNFSPKDAEEYRLQCDQVKYERIKFHS